MHHGFHERERFFDSLKATLDLAEFHKNSEEVSLKKCSYGFL